MKAIQRFVILTVIGFCAAGDIIRYQPEQIHLSLGGKYNVRLFNWRNNLRIKFDLEEKF